MAYRVSFRWLKPYMPRSLYGRAALILILPVVTLQLGISIVFIQRHFERVTEQMTMSIVLDLDFLLDTVNGAPDLAAAQAEGQALAERLGLEAQIPVAAIPAQGTRVWYDLSGRVVQRSLRASIDSLVQIDLPDNDVVRLWFRTAQGPMEVTFPRSRVSASNPHQLLVWMVFLGVFMTLISYIYLRNQLRPIKRLAAAATDYGRGRVVPYHPAGANEVRAAGNAFLDMRNRIERQTQTRTMMLSGVSHDMRTPLTRLRLGLGMIDDEEAGPLIRDVDDMQRLLDTFLEFARDDAEEAAEPTDALDLARVILADAARLGQAVTEGQWTVEEGAPATIPMRAHAIRRAVENLIGNALRYGKTARLNLSVTPRAVVFGVEDDGPGIPAEQREDAVRPFTRLDPARNQDRGSGVGLGLAIVSDIARSHGGTLRLGQSDDLGGLNAEIVLAR